MDREILTVKKAEQIYKLIGEYKVTQNIKIGLNETIKAIKSGTAVLVVLADDSVPQCLTESVVVLCEQQGVKCVYVSSKESLGKACKLSIHAVAVAIVEQRDFDNTKMMKDLAVF